MNTTTDIINELVLILEQFNEDMPLYANNTDFLIDKFKQLKDSIQKNDNRKSDLINWSLWFAPRIIFDSINEDNILKKLEELNAVLGDKEK